MNQLYVLGTGHALVTELYNSCFAVCNEGEFLLLDGGGGNGILSILKKMNVPLGSIKAMFISHEHIDHLLGCVWIFRAIADAINFDKYTGNFSIYAEPSLLEKLKTICSLTLQQKEVALIGSRIFLCPVSDGECLPVLSYNATFFNSGSERTVQFGCRLQLPSGGILTYLGDEPLHSENEKYVKNAQWLIAEALCLDSEEQIFKPHEISHGTVADSCSIAQKLQVQNLVLTHTEDTHGSLRKQLYQQEGKRFFNGNLFVPDDGEIIDLA